MDCQTAGVLWETCGFRAIKTIGRKSAIFSCWSTSDLAHLPPIKVVTILSGAAELNVVLCRFMHCRTRSSFLRSRLGALIIRRGERDFIERRLGLLAGAASAVILVVFL